MTSHLPMNLRSSTRPIRTAGRVEDSTRQRTELPIVRVQTEAKQLILVGRDPIRSIEKYLDRPLQMKLRLTSIEVAIAVRLDDAVRHRRLDESA